MSYFILAPSIACKNNNSWTLISFFSFLCLVLICTLLLFPLWGLFLTVGFGEHKDCRSDIQTVKAAYAAQPVLLMFIYLHVSLCAVFNVWKPLHCLTLLPSIYRIFSIDGSDGKHHTSLQHPPLSPTWRPVCFKTVQRGGLRCSHLHLYHRSVSYADQHFPSFCVSQT